ncbi:Uncharacterised protein [Vibrio cholerae]|nr:Uncharacterised protein [Vibrio cholerae]CSD19340.1 Uncharacterised protein [Vibrio cholerae]
MVGIAAESRIHSFSNHTQIGKHTLRPRLQGQHFTMAANLQF